MDGLSVSLQDKQHVLAVRKFLNVIRQPAFSHLFRVLYRCPGRGGMALQRCDELVHVFFQQVRPHDKHHFIRSLHFVSKLISTWYLVFSRKLAAVSLFPCCFVSSKQSQVPTTNY